jgi:SHS2 domain-containing protein
LENPLYGQFCLYTANNTFQDRSKLGYCALLVVKTFTYRLLDEIAIADACFELNGKNLTELFRAGFLALMSTSVELDSVKLSIERKIMLENNDLERLLYEFLEELIYLKDAELLIFKECDLSIEENNVTSKFILNAVLRGQKIDDLVSTITDVKAITYYQFYIKQIENGWKARVTFDL